MNEKNLLTNIKNKLISLYTSKTTASYIAIGVTGFIVIAAITIGSIALISAITSEKRNEQHTIIEASAIDTTTEEETTISSTTTETPSENTTTPETTTLETTTEAPTTAEITTQKPTTAPPPPTIAVEDLNIGNDEEEKTAETTKNNRYEDFYEDEIIETTTKKPAETTTKKPVETTTTKKPAETTTTQKPSETTTVSKPIEKPVEETTEKPSETPTAPGFKEDAKVVKGIDVSKWNSQDKKNKIDWNKVKNSGVEYVIIRAGYRGQVDPKLYEDPYFHEHIKGAQDAGLQVGVYFYSQAITEQEALEEASFLLSIIKDYKITYPVCFDWEPVDGSRAKKAKLTKSQASAIARKFLSTMEGYGYDTMLYSYHSAIVDYFNTELVNDYKVWMARYLTAYKDNGVEYAHGDKIPSTTYPFQMWQYTDSGIVPGIEGVVDVNVSFISYTESGELTSNIEIIPPAKTYNINVGESVDYITGLVAYNSVAVNITDSVTIAIKNASGSVVTKEQAFNTPGVYTITYTAKDFTNITKNVNSKLIVKVNPTITLLNDTLTFNRSTTTYDDIITAAFNNIASMTNFEGKPVDTSYVTITGLDAFYNENDETTPDNTNELLLGSYEVTYNLKDEYEFTATAKITITITDDDVNQN